MTLTKFAKSLYIHESLVRAVVRQMGGWESFKQSASDVANHGIDGGFHGFIYYADTVKFAKRNKSEILNVCRDLASEIGESGAYGLIAGFKCLKMDADKVADAIHNPRHNEHTSVMNALAWFAAEEVCRAYADLN